MEVVVRDGQTLADVAIQEYGALEAVVQLAFDNSISVSDVPQTGTALRLHEKTYSRVMRDYCRTRGVQPATLRGNSTTRERIFNDIFNDTFS